MLRGNRHAEIADRPTSKMNHALHELLLAMWRWNFRENLSTRRDMAKKEIKYLLEMTLPKWSTCSQYMVQRIRHCHYRRHNLLRFLRCTPRGFSGGVPEQTGYKISTTVRTPSPLNQSQISSDTEGSCDLGTFVICKERTLLAKHSNKMSKDSGK